MDRNKKKYARELRFWRTKWKERLKHDWWSKDIPRLLKISSKPGHFLSQERAVHESRALFLRVLKETRIKNKKFFKNKIVVDVGPGPMGFLEGSDAKVKIAIDPLARAYAKYNLLLPNSDAVYLNIPAEKLPLLDESIDIVVSRNNLDHVRSPKLVIKEIIRIIRPGGYFVLNVDINHPPFVAEPHNLHQKDILRMTKGLNLIRKIIYKQPHGWKGQMFVGLFRKPFHTKIK